MAAMQKTRPRGRRMPWLMRLGLGVVAFLAVLAVVAPWVVQDPERQSLRARLKPPTLEGADGRAHLLGTDHLGRDVLARVVVGTVPTMGIALLGLALTLAGGVTSALVAGAGAGRLAARALDALAQAMLSFPPMWVPLVVLAVGGRSLAALTVAVV
ncbi:MAG TPA: hypothetical protein VE482_09715, partial [Candidatus Eisenbacteria bacterium]|nr:hypothetical protein [Candidatus Eisenbacteria bacterium]